MRKTIGETKEALEFMHKLDGLSEDAREHFRLTLLKLVDCYSRDDTYGVLLISRKDKPNIMLGINCNDLESTALLQEACGAMIDFHIDDMPEKGMLN